MQHDHMDMLQPTGNLIGHVGPGMAYLVWAAAWLIAFARDPGPVGVVQPIERHAVWSWLKILALPVGVSAELPQRTWSAMSIAMSWQHISVYLPLALSGVVDLLARRGRLSPQATHGAYAVAFATGGLVMFGHGNPPGVEGRSHVLLAGTYLACALAGLLELAWPGPRARLLRAGTQFALGLWLVVIGWVLFLSGWDLADHARVMWVVTLYAWTVTAAAAVVALASAGAGPQRQAP
jgi:hypothetical protein